jgi:dihydroorotate dehydrogenase
MSSIELMYKNWVRPRVFASSVDDPETAHEWGLKRLKILERYPILEAVAKNFLSFEHPMLATTQFGIRFRSPLGLAAGFDKYCEVYRRGIPATGWAFAEIGGITPLRQDGNPRHPARMMRSEELQAIWNFMGFNNPGEDHAAQQMQINGPSSIPIGLNVGKGKDTPQEKAGEDYAQVIGRMSRYVQFITINVSSPNTKHLRALQAKNLLTEIVSMAIEANERCLPIGIKVSPDESDEQLSDIADIAIEKKLSFLILTNTTTKRDRTMGWGIPAERGGVSGRPLTERSRSVLKLMASRFPRKHSVRLISVGGIDSAAELYRRILTGASLCQVFTAWPFEGPDLCKRWLNELVDRLIVDGFGSINHAIGAGL